jgi:multicomponent Na+:H+ antiporter subunit B
MEKSVFTFAAKRIKPVMILFSIIILLRGHNEPGGGFIGGLIAASAWILTGIAFGAAEVRNEMRVKPGLMMAMGLLLAVLSSLPSFINGVDFMTGSWLKIPLFDGSIKLGTPLLFDLGVYFAVIGFSLNVIFTLMEEWRWK